MKRRTVLKAGLLSMVSTSLNATEQQPFGRAIETIQKSVDSGLVKSAVLRVEQRGKVVSRTFGAVTSESAMFLLGSISKPICVTALMSLYDEGKFQLDDRLQKYLPEFRGEGRDNVTLRHLLAHSSGLPDQLPENDSLRRGHASLQEFVQHATRVPLHFSPGTKYEYSSMGILLATHVAELLSGKEIRQLVAERVFDRLGMQHSAQGLGKFRIDELVPVQTEHAAPEAGGGDPSAKDWDWNSPYWRALGAPWGGTHASAEDIATFLKEFLYSTGKAVKPETAKLMITNHNAPSVTPRGLGLNIGRAAGSPGCSDETFGHTGSTGTIAWADPKSDTICVILTSLPARAVPMHPRDVAAAQVATEA